MYRRGRLRPAMCDEIVHVKGTGAIFLGGPPLVKAATGEEVTADQLGGAEVHCIESGVSDYFAEDDAHAISIVRKIVETLPKNEKARLTMREPKPPLYDPKEIYGIVSGDLKIPYDCREVIARIVDGSEFLEFKELTDRHWCADLPTSTDIPSGFWGITAFYFPKAP